MQYHKQIIHHDPENGFYGDCHRTALACILDMSPEEVPNFMHGLDDDDGAIFEKLQRKFLKTLGLVPIIVPYPSDEGLELVLESIKKLSPKVYYLLGGESVRGIGHTVVGYENKIIHDPHPSNKGVKFPMSDGFYWVTYIGKLFDSP